MTWRNVVYICRGMSRIDVFNNVATLRVAPSGDGEGAGK